jgi:hypothetical protein
VYRTPYTVHPTVYRKSEQYSSSESSRVVSNRKASRHIAPSHIIGNRNESYRTVRTVPYHSVSYRTVQRTVRSTTVPFSVRTLFLYRYCFVPNYCFTFYCAQCALDFSFDDSELVKLLALVYPLSVEDRVKDEQDNTKDGVVVSGTNGQATTDAKITTQGKATYADVLKRSTRTCAKGGAEEN